MVASSWTLRVNPASKTKIENWLTSECPTGFSVNEGQDAIEVEIHDIDLAFKFRMRFDEEILEL